MNVIDLFLIDKFQSDFFSGKKIHLTQTYIIDQNFIRNFLKILQILIDLCDHTFDSEFNISCICRSFTSYSGMFNFFSSVSSLSLLLLTFVSSEFNG